MKTKICQKCNKEFKKSIFCSEKEWKTRKYCSHSCANSVNALNNGKQFEKGITPWNKDKKIPSNTGKNNSRWTRVEKICEECGKEFIVRNYRKDIARFCSKKCANENRDEGKTSENYRIRRSIEFRLWRESVFARDNWTCQKYGIKGGKLHPHHILNFSDHPELRFAIDNGVTLSEKAHKEFHKIYGFNNNTKGQLLEFLAEQA